MKIKAKMEALAYGGEFIGPVLDPQPLRGKKAFARFVCPGETIEAEIEKDLKSFVRAGHVSILTPSPEREDPPCPHFGTCGGCDLQHLKLAPQRRHKLEMVRSMLARQAGLNPEVEPHLIGENLPGFYYRRRVNLHLDRNGRLGFYMLSSNTVVSLKECLIASRKINKTIKDIVSFLCSELSDIVGGVIIEEHGGEIFIELKLRPEVKVAASAIPDRLSGLLKHAFNVRVSLRGHFVYQSSSPVDLPVGHFSQVNEQANQVLIECVKRLVEGEQVDDLYAGSGNLAIPLAEGGKNVRAIEVDAALTAYGLRSSSHLKKNLKYYTMSCEKFVSSYELRPSVILDPPRSGAKTILSKFNPGNVQEIIYVSCNLPSLARDLSLLVQKGFTYSQTYVLDMFPQTHHVETISYLRAG